MEGVPFEAADAEYYRLPAILLHEIADFINPGQAVDARSSSDGLISGHIAPTLG
jgi:hypothetical protein